MRQSDTRYLSILIGCLLVAALALHIHQTPSRDIPHQLSSPQVSLRLTPTSSPPPAHRTAATVTPTAIPHQSLDNTNRPNKEIAFVRFADETARETFLSVNHFTPDELQPLPGLQVYQLSAATFSLTPGVQKFENHQYRASLTPTDPLAASQWYQSRINAPVAWDSQTGTAAPVVAVIDTGFALSHEDLTTAWATNPGEVGPTAQEGPAPNCTSRGQPLDKSCNNLDDDNDGLTDNVTGWNFVSNTNSVQAGAQDPTGSGVSHGTMTASLITSSANNGKGGSGINWKGRILPLQALSDDGTGSTASVALAVRYAVDSGAKIINLSLGGNADDPILAEQISYAIAQGVTVVAAAGNDGCNCMNYPAAYPNVIAVGAINSSNTRASFSNTGNSLTLVAPGTNICTAMWSASQPTNAYGCGSGTSFSAPLVSATASLLLSQNPTLTRGQLTTALIASAQKLSAMNGANWTSSYGYGVLDVAAALATVSLPTPIGQPLSTHAITLSQVRSGPLAYLADGLNSNCLSNVANATCKVRAIQLKTNQVVQLSTNETTNGLTDLNWFAGDKLSPGQWLIQSYVVAAGIQSLTRSEILTISP